jgi:dolichyl-phosphate-mannose--protein O-mannosyl transferase
LIAGWTRYDRRTAAVAMLSLAFLPVLVYGLSFIRYLTIIHGITNLPQPPLGFAPFHLNLGRAWTDIAEWHRQTWLYHINLKADHIFYSPWWSWPLDFRPVVYYYQGQGLGIDQTSGTALVAEIFNLGNPLTWWGGTVAIVALLIALPRLIAAARRTHALDDRLWTVIFILVAFFAAWLPFAKVPRGLFLYHMLGGLPAMFLALALGLTYISTLGGPLASLKLRLNGAVPATAYLVMVVLFFFYFYPLWTGLPLTSEALNNHVWFVFTKPLPNWCLCYWTSPG